MLSVALPLWGAQVTTNHFETLKQSNWFATHGGIGNMITPEGIAVAAICNQTNCVALFRELLKEKQPAQQLYGLLGLQLMNAPDFKDVLPKFTESQTKVRVLSGCIAGEWEVREVARRIGEKQWKLRPEPVPGGKYEMHLEQR